MLYINFFKGIPIIVPIKTNLSLKKKALPKKLLFFLLAQTFSLKEKLYQKNYFLSTGSFSKRKCFIKRKSVLYALIYDFGHGVTLYP